MTGIVPVERYIDTQRDIGCFGRPVRLKFDMHHLHLFGRQWLV